MLTLVIGKNNTGKSNLLEAFRLCTPKSFRAFLAESATTHGSLVLGGDGLDFLYPSTGWPTAPASQGEPFLRAGFAIGPVVIGLAIDRHGHFLCIEWYRDQRRICTLVLSDNIEHARAKFVWSSARVQHLDGRSLTKRLMSNDLDGDFDRLHALLAGSARIAYHRAWHDDKRLIDALEVRLSTDLPKGRTKEFLERVCRWFDIPSILLLPLTVTNKVITPTPRQQRTEASDFAELAHLREVLRQATRRRSRKKVTNQVVQFVDDLAAAVDPARQTTSSPGSGGLNLKDDWSSVKNLGSGFRSLLLLCLEIELNDVILIDEPESFLHPGLQSRLVSYLLNHALHKQVIIASHSEVFLDAFYRMPSIAVIVETARVAQHLRVTNVRERGAAEILDALGIRASHILQANGVIWVEGPSDRILIRRWIELWTHGRLSEGAHYQVVCYGGRLLSHYSAERAGPGMVERIEMLRINRHAIVVMDSDRRSAADELNATKRRVIAEVSSGGGLVWVTMGRSIENYIPRRVLMALGFGAQDFGEYESIDAILPGGHSGFGKVEIAKRAADAMARADIEGRLDLGSRLRDVCALISLWNGIDSHEG